MAIDVNESHEITEFGLAFTDDNGNVIAYVTSGTGSPVGTAAPVPTIYIENNGDVWRKFGTDNADWQKLAKYDFSVCSTNECLQIPDKQELVVSSLTLEDGGSLVVPATGALKILK